MVSWLSLLWAGTLAANRVRDHGRPVVKISWCRLVAWTAVIASLATDLANGDEPASPSAGTTASDDVVSQRIAALGKQLSGCVFKGRFSIDGKEGDLREETYEITGATKLPAGDVWLIKTRIRYGDHDVTVPLPIPIRWADATPVMVVDQLTIPGLGTFDARVVISGDRYAGTWQHGDVGGHLFGKIEPAQPKRDPAALGAEPRSK